MLARHGAAGFLAVTARTAGFKERGIPVIVGRARTARERRILELVGAGREGAKR